MTTYPTTRHKRAGMVAVSGLVLLDALVTSVFVTKYGLAAEANPFMRHVISTSGFAGMYMVKFVGIALYWAAMVWYKDVKGHEYSLWPEILLCLFLIPTCVVGLVFALV